MYEALDWLVKRQGKIEKRLGQRQLRDGTLELYNVSSSYYTGRKSKFVQYGDNRDGRREFPQIVYGLLCNAEGCPVAIKAFPGNTADANTLSMRQLAEAPAPRQGGSVARIAQSILTQPPIQYRLTAFWPKKLGSANESIDGCNPHIAEALLIADHSWLATRRCDETGSGTTFRRTSS